jgi:hypothetical protein
MEKYKVSFTYMTFRQSEIVEAETIWKAQDIIKEKYGEENVKIIATASTKNTWC